MLSLSESLLVATLVLVVVIFICRNNDGWPIAFVCMLGCLVGSCSTSEVSREQDVRRAAQRKADAIPHVVREADGCKVYAFQSNELWHYFTRCPDSKTTTESHHKESYRCGKSTCQRDVSETIDSE